MSSDALALGLLDEVCDDRRITDVVVTCDGRVWVDRGAGMSEHHLRVPFRSPRMVREYAVQLCAQLGRRLDDACPIADASNVEGVRVNAVIPPLVPQGAAIAIRFPDRAHPSLDALCRQGMMPQEWLPVLHGLVARRASIVVTGGTGVGKTTLVKALLAQCDPRERVVSVEEVRELGMVGLANHVSLVTREANVEGMGAVGLPELVKATLRMRPDRIMLGECRGEEIVDLLRAFNSGHRGGMTTVHADSVSRVPARLISLGLLADVNPQAMAMLVEGAFDVVLHLERRAGRRVIAQIGVLACHAGQLEGVTLATWDGRTSARYASAWREFAHRWAVA